MAGVLVIIPTYNERGNLETLARDIFKLDIPNLKILVVDDNSPDGTGELAARLKSQYPIEVRHRPAKMGLGRAYREAFEEILSSTPERRPDFVIHMDADLSHDPRVISVMLKKIRECDLVVGSRYMAGGTIKNWNIMRRLLSRLANFYARMLLQVPYRDLTSGYKCYRLSTLENFDLADLSSIGYSFLVETTYQAHKQGAKILEIPITFIERKSGVSKLDLQIIIESFIKILKLAFKKKSKL